MSLQKLGLGSMFNFFNGKSPSIQADGDYPVYGSNGIIGQSKQFMYEDSIILGRVGDYCGSVARCKLKCWASDNTIVVKTKSGFDINFAYYLLKHLPLNSYAGGAAQPLNFAAGAAQPNISPSQIEAIKLLLPNDSLLHTYLETCKPCLDQMLALTSMNQKLKQARDLLLPRLMNGELAV